MHTTRPAWYRTARNIGGAPWVPFEVARSLQERLQAHQQRLAQLEQRLGAAQDQRDVALGEAALAKERARELSERPAPPAPEPAPPPAEESATLEHLREDLARVRGRTAQEIADARQAERDAGVERLLTVHDDLSRGMEALPRDPDSPWYQGYAAILQQLAQQLEQAGARPFGAVGERFDPQRHDAVGTVPARNSDEFDRVVGLTQRGFVMDDERLLRPAKVVVATRP